MSVYFNPDNDPLTAIEKLRDAYPEISVAIGRIVDLVFAPRELWRLENYGDKFFGELERRLTGLRDFAIGELRDNHGIEDPDIHTIKEICDFSA